MVDFCQYKNILGKPGVGFHNHFGTPFALLDVAGTMGIGYWITRKYKIPFMYSFGGLMVGAVFIHKMFCVDTTINKWLFD